MARLQYAVPWKQFIVQPGLLAIYHTTEDTRLVQEPDFAGVVPATPERIIVSGSQGLTLNLTVDARYRMNAAWSIEASFGSPVVTRDVRPDGLTRSLVLNAGLAYRFGK